MLSAVVIAATAILNVGYAINPDAPKFDVQIRSNNVMVGAQMVSQAHAEMYLYAGLYYNLKISPRLTVTPMFAVGQYHEEQRRKYWRFKKGDNWDTRYMFGLEATYRVSETVSAGVFYNHITNLKNSWSPRAFAMHMNDLGGAGATLGFTIQKGF